MLRFEEDQSDWLDFLRLIFKVYLFAFLLRLIDLLFILAERLMNNDLLKWKRVPIEHLSEMAPDICNAAKPALAIPWRFHLEEPKARQDVAEVLLLDN